MHFVIFGLTVSSSWGNGHATLWRGLLAARAQRGHTAVFYERDVSYYAAARRTAGKYSCGRAVRLYDSFEDVRGENQSSCAMRTSVS